MCMLCSNGWDPFKKADLERSRVLDEGEALRAELLVMRGALPRYESLASDPSACDDFSVMAARIRARLAELSRQL